MWSRRRQRIIALQALYMSHQRHGEIPVEELIEFSWIKNKNKQLPFTCTLVQLVIDNLHFVDSTIQKLLMPKSIEALNLIDIILLRIAIVEILYVHTECRVVIHEIIEIANTYSSETSYKLLNGLLQTFVDSKESLKTEKYGRDSVPI